MTFGHLPSNNLQGSYVATCADDIFGGEWRPVAMGSAPAATGMAPAILQRRAAQTGLASRWFCAGNYSCGVRGESIEVKPFANGRMNVQYPCYNKSGRKGGHIMFKTRSTVLVPGNRDKRRAQWILHTMSCGDPDMGTCN